MTGRHSQIPGWRDLQCEWCGPEAGFFTLLSAHLTRAHGVGSIARYRKEFSGVQLASEAYTAGKRAILADRVEDGYVWEYSKRRRLCQRGHRLTKTNIVMGPNGQRSCRKCCYDASRRYRSTDEFRAKKAEYERQRLADPEYRSKRTEYQRQRRLDPEVRANENERNRQFLAVYRADPERRARAAEYSRQWRAAKKAEARA